LAEPSIDEIRARLNALNQSFSAGVGKRPEPAARVATEAVPRPARDEDVVETSAADIVSDDSIQPVSQESGDFVFNRSDERDSRDDFEITRPPREDEYMDDVASEYRDDDDDDLDGPPAYLRQPDAETPPEASVSQPAVATDKPKRKLPVPAIVAFCVMLGAGAFLLEDIVAGFFGKTEKPQAENKLTAAQLLGAPVPAAPAMKPYSSAIQKPLSSSQAMAAIAQKPVSSAAKPVGLTVTPVVAPVASAAVPKVEPVKQQAGVAAQEVAKTGEGAKKSAKVKAGKTSVKSDVAASETEEERPVVRKKKRITKKTVKTKRVAAHKSKNRVESGPVVNKAEVEQLLADLSRARSAN